MLYLSGFTTSYRNKMMPSRPEPNPDLTTPASLWVYIGTLKINIWKRKDPELPSCPHQLPWPHQSINSNLTQNYTNKPILKYFYLFFARKTQKSPPACWIACFLVFSFLKLFLTSLLHYNSSSLINFNGHCNLCTAFRGVFWDWSSYVVWQRF